MTLSEANGRIDHLEKELESVIDLLGSKRDRINLFISRIDEIGQALGGKSMSRRSGARMIMDLLPKARELRGSLDGAIERCKIALEGEVVE